LPVQVFLCFPVVGNTTIYYYLYIEGFRQRVLKSFCFFKSKEADAAANIIL
jgi:hypothetical protein